MKKFTVKKRGAMVGLAAAALFALAVLVPSAEATFPGENGSIAFGSNGDACGTNAEHDFEIFLLEPDANGCALTQLTFNAASDNLANWSPDGERIVFRSRRDGNSEIYVMNADGSEQTRLTDNSVPDEFPSSSADGNRVYFTSLRGGNVDVYVMNADGSNQTPLTNNPAVDARGVESPDGRTIAFVSTRSGHSAIYTMNPAGSQVRRLTDDALEASTPNWSPDGTMIAFNSNECAMCTAAADIYVIKSNGSGLRRLTANFGNNQWPFWSPDGEQIAFTHWADLTFPPSDIYSVEADGSGTPVNVTNSPGVEDQWSAWQPVPDRD